MTRIIKGIALAAVSMAAVAASPAWAGCGPEIKPSAYSQDGAEAARLIPAAFTERTVVGMWSVKFVDKNNNVIDFGYVQWHSDGTEIMNSGGRSPASENFCLGVWSQVGPFRYLLNHRALSYDPASGRLNAKITIKEDVVVDPTNTTYSGPFSITVFDPTSGRQLQKVVGRVTGERVTARD